MRRRGVVAAALLALVGAGSASASGVHLVVAPTRVAPGGVVRVSAAASPCPVGDQVTLISAAFRGHAFGGQGAVNGQVRSRGSFAARAHIRSGLQPGRYEVTARCGGGNLGASAFFRVVPRRSTFAVYLVRGEHVAPVRRVVAHTTAVARAALTVLLRGPTAAEQRQGYTSAIPASTSLRGVSLSHGLLTVDLSGRFQAGGGSLSMLLRVAQAVYSATQFPTVDRVAFRLDGKPVDAIGGEGVLVSPPVGRAAFERQAPAILVEQPLPGDHVSLPLVVRGTADVFEAQFVVEVRTTSGKVLVRRSVHAAAGSGTRGSFDIRLPLSTTAKRLALIAYDTSPRNGSRIDIVRVPITIG
jgi:Sporulation and spore germination/Immunoglobulin-like domain of bacterial spore germination